MEYVGIKNVGINHATKPVRRCVMDEANANGWEWLGKQKGRKMDDVQAKGGGKKKEWEKGMDDRVGEDRSESEREDHGKDTRTNSCPLGSSFHSSDRGHSPTPNADDVEHARGRVCARP